MTEPLTTAAEKLLADLAAGRIGATDTDELSARLWMVEREVEHRAAASPSLDVERWTWADHLVTEHGAWGTDNATPCYHRRGTVGDEQRTTAIAAEYDRLTPEERHDQTLSETAAPPRDRGGSGKRGRGNRGTD